MFHKRAFLLSSLLLISLPGFGKEKKMMGKNINIALPVVSMGGEAVLRVEYGLGMMGSIGLEGSFVQESEIYTGREIEENNGDSIVQEGREISLLYSNFSEPNFMSGFYWAAGVGYRTVDVVWQRTPSLRFAPLGAKLNSNGKFVHAMTHEGVTARLRLGYRYVARSFPFSIGAYLGVRHFENKAVDEQDGDSLYVVTPDEDRISIERRLMSSLEPGVEVGIAF